MAKEPESQARLSTRAATVRAGVAGWSYPDWDGIVYPPGERVDGLAHLARYFDTLEINSSFYRIPSRETTRSWVRRVAHNPEFRFAVKLYRGFTHERNAGSQEMEAFEHAVAPIAESGRLGALLVQFPWSFKNEPDSVDYLTDVLHRLRDYPAVVEVRHDSWRDRTLLELLAAHETALCNIDQPVIGRSIGPSQDVTASVAYFRLHGRNYEQWFSESAGRDERYDYLYSPDELDPWIERINESSGAASEVFVITNNHFRGQAVVNALQIRSRLERRRAKAPLSLVKAYPVLRDVTEVDLPAQGSLF